ncbi:MAG TPA: GerMN domain-containing protein [Terriglobales bacterium]
MIPRQWIIATVILVAVATGMGIYVWQLRGRESANPLPVAAEPHVTPPAPGPAENATVWVAYDSSGTLRGQTVSVPMSSRRQQRAEELMRALLSIYTAKNSPHPLAPGAEVRNVFLVDPGIAVIDLNSAFVDGQTSGMLAEELTLASLIQTLSANIPGLMRVKVLVDGKERDTLAGHADLSGFYDVSQVSELAKQLTGQ